VFMAMLLLLVICIISPLDRRDGRLFPFIE
jgi:hypothetical protein